LNVYFVLIKNYGKNQDKRGVGKNTGASSY